MPRTFVCGTNPNHLSPSCQKPRLIFEWSLKVLGRSKSNGHSCIAQHRSKRAQTGVAAAQQGSAPGRPSRVVRSRPIADLRAPSQPRSLSALSGPSGPCPVGAAIRSLRIFGPLPRRSRSRPLADIYGLGWTGLLPALSGPSGPCPAAAAIGPKRTFGVQIGRNRFRPSADLGPAHRCRSAASPNRTFIASRSIVQGPEVRSAD